MNRPNPFDYAFAALADDRFPAVREEAEETLKDTGDRSQFATLSSVQRILGDVESPDLIEQDPHAGEAYLTVMYVAYRFWSAGRRVLSTTAQWIDAALETGSGAEPPQVPDGACYVQFPEHWCWAQVDAEAPHEPLDGIFVVQSSREEITVLAVLGFRPDRPGFSEVTVTALPADFAFAAGEARTPPFAPLLDGGEAAGLRSLVSEAEVLHLASLALATGKH
jgi:hypothetical protein